MTDFNWFEECERAVKRMLQKGDSGAVGALDGILGMAPAQNSHKYMSCYTATSNIRTRHQNILARRKKKPLEPGSTGIPHFDQQIELLRQNAAA